MSEEADPKLPYAEQKAADLARVKKHVDQLSAHFDAVHVFGVRYNQSSGNTFYVNVGEGNYLMRYGQVKSWILREEELLRNGDSEDDSDEQK